MPNFVAAWMMILVPLSAAAQCSGEAAVAELAARWIEQQPLRGISPALSLEVAQCARERFVAQLQAHKDYGGRVVGYKAALTNAALQKRFGASAPVRGVLLTPMPTMESALPVRGEFGVRPVFEADLLVEVAVSVAG
jgi:2-keto-4-pentenoate hydratase